MKKILFFLTVFGLSLTSCSTDEQPTSGENAQTTSVLLDDIVQFYDLSNVAFDESDLEFYNKEDERDYKLEQLLK